MRVMVTGSTGFVGFHTVMSLLRNGHEVCLGVRNPEKMRRAFAPFGVQGLDYVEGSITDEAAVQRALDNCDGVVHAAAMVNLDRKQAEFVRRTNVRGTELVVGGAVERGIQSIVYVSSITALFTPGLDSLTEDSPLGSASSGYGKSKVESELYVRGLQEQGAPISITYATSIVGPFDPGFTEPLRGLAHFLNHAIPNTSTGLQMVDVRDLADIHVKLLESRSTGRYIVGGHYVPWDTLGDVLEEITGCHVMSIPTPGWAFRFAGRIGDLIKRFISFELPLTLEATTYASKWVWADSARVRKDLQFEFRDLNETLADTLLWMTRFGHINRKWAERGLPERTSPDLLKIDR